MPLLGALLGAGYYVATRGLGHVAPESMLWLRSSDRLIYLGGWLSFWRDPWAWPLGKIVSQLDPIGSYVAYTDSIPWFSALMKLLVQAHHQALQFFGVYLVLAYSLFGYFSYRIFELFKLEPRDRLLATLLMLSSPVLIHRANHIALCSHWLILAAFYLYFLERLRGPKLFAWLVLVFFASATNPYLAVMVFGVSLASAFARRSVVLAGSCLAAMSITFWAFGYLSVSDRGEGGFEYYSSDLIAFFNSMWLSRFLPQIRMAPRQYEGFAYMGLGMLALGALVLLGRLKSARWRGVRGLRPLFCAAGLFAFYSLSSHVSIAGHTLFTIEWFYRPFPQITSAFRSCGRFMWVLYYLFMVAILVKVATSDTISRNKATAILILGILLQWFDLGPAIGQHREDAGELPAAFSAAQWYGLPPDLHRLEFVPAGFPREDACRADLLIPTAYTRFEVFAFERRLESNFGTRAHQDPNLLLPECREASASARQKGLQAEVAYIFPEGTEAKGQKSTCRDIQGFTICWKANR